MSLGIESRDIKILASYQGEERAVQSFCHHCNSHRVLVHDFC